MNKKLRHAIKKSIIRFEKEKYSTICPLCRYQAKKHGCAHPSIRCPNCPLTIVDKSCFTEGSAYNEFIRTKDNTLIIKALKKALQYVEELDEEVL